MQKRRDAKKDRLDETDSQNWSNIARDAVDALDIGTPTKSSVPKKRKNKSVKAESPLERPKKKSKVEKKKKEKALQKEAEEKKKKKKKKDKKTIARNDDDVDDDSEDDSEEEEEEQTALPPVVVAEDPRLAPESSKKKRKVLGAVFPQNQRTKRPHFPEIDDVWIAPPISSGTTVDSKGKSVVNEEEKHNPAPEVHKDTFAKPFGSGQPAPPYGDLPAKFEKFCSQFDSQRSEDISDMFSDPESVQKIQFATSLLADITQQANNFDCGVHVLYIITKMIEAEKNGKLLEYLEKGGLPVEWGTAEIVANYRQEVRDLFISLVESDT
ncbi:hypothetical protein R1sor_016759 [Riccia sorocarpa]|uniref:Ubiquitin-like protease family profile domain-containing protein n=1 Tax=Riccia sorocarpa TaxID=122646 RepID=A0ABD3HFV0_9MARC